MTLKIGDHVSHQTLGYLGTVTVIADGQDRGPYADQHGYAEMGFRSDAARR
jgi:hypothetical protein